MPFDTTGFKPAHETKRPSTPAEFVAVAVDGLLAQGRPASNPETGACYLRYVAEDGAVLKCAFGLLVPDNEYDKGKEQSFFPALIPGLYGDLFATKAMMKLQGMHDAWAGMRAGIYCDAEKAAHYLRRIDTDLAWLTAHNLLDEERAEKFRALLLS